MTSQIPRPIPLTSSLIGETTAGGSYRFSLTVNNMRNLVDENKISSLGIKEGKRKERKKTLLCPQHIRV